MKLLVVEDEALLRHHLHTRLSETGHVVQAVGNGEEALYQAEEFAFDLAIIDLGLPGMSGLDLIRQLRSQGKSTPFSGYELPGRVLATVVNGHVAFEA